MAVAATKKAQEEQARKERLALAKRLMHRDDDSENEEGEEGEGEGEEGDEEAVGNGGEQDIMALMGFTGFDSTKGKPVTDNKKSAAVGVVSKHKRRIYRQYMNRRGGFNRPLQKLS